MAVLNFSSSVICVDRGALYIQTVVCTKCAAVEPRECISLCTVVGRVVRGMPLAVTVCDLESLRLRGLN
jgi:hypothetical protein